MVNINHRQKLIAQNSGFFLEGAPNSLYNNTSRDFAISTDYSNITWAPKYRKLSTFLLFVLQFGQAYIEKIPHHWPLVGGIYQLPVVFPSQRTRNAGIGSMLRRYHVVSVPTRGLYYHCDLRLSQGFW